MSDKSITAANFLPGPNAKYEKGKGGAAITIGQSVYLDTTTNLWKLGDANASAATAKAGGVAATTCAASGQDILVDVEDDQLKPGFTPDLSAAGDKGVYVLSATPGGIAPVGDLATGYYPQVLMVALDATYVKLLRNARGTSALT